LAGINSGVSRGKQDQSDGTQALYVADLRQHPEKPVYEMEGFLELLELVAEEARLEGSEAATARISAIADSPMTSVPADFRCPRTW
jgi:hypothetical protein